MDYILCLLVGMLIGLLVAQAPDFSSPTLTETTPCPHGNEDWDDCPVCGH